MKEKINPNHHMGKQTGYDLIDGVYHIAPLYQNQFVEIEHKKRGIEQMVTMVTHHASEELTELSKANQEVWKRLSEDLELDIAKSWSYSNGTIRELEKK